VNRFRIAVTCVTLGVAALATACGSDAKATSTTPTIGATTAMAPASTATPVSSQPMDALTVTIGEFKFEPPEIHVPVGATVTWTNTHDQPHTATSAGNFNTGAIQPGESQTVTFATAGTYSYICSFHPFMNGTVVVG
jgi:amicyanin